MTDYGHDLLFGSFVTPSSARPAEVVELAVTSERAGLDLVTFQDHPYQPALLDTQALLAFVAARTTRVRLAANVTNLPLRPPAVLARTAATLDLLSGGRFELGIGAGGFRDAVVAMGGRGLPPGESVDALAEAIGLIRALWNTEERGGVHHRGTYYAADGAKRGPRPAHDIGVWIGAYGPRMLALTGRTATGWLPSYDYLKGGTAALPAMNARIDEAAEEAGRDPREIRRFLNIMKPEQATADFLTELATEHGISGFIVGGDDEAALRRLGEEVAPAVRAAVSPSGG
ncbi:LLM class flavin-dependent oxidoreductase [Streptomyces sp. Tu6071]|uniref:LLM class flavin-dependent oxidoreductase n=1 Tax=Streptomyces sp. Tu6071 TaxID=355249 RepID=UPI0005B786FE|nr:LLM class flavin-dependent oxidoreductase [Streptomyces sp. Tu6071]